MALRGFGALKDKNGGLCFSTWRINYPGIYSDSAGMLRLLWLTFIQSKANYAGVIFVVKPRNPALSSSKLPW